MGLQDPQNPELKALLPVVNYSVNRRLVAGEPDYWDHATLLELAILGEDSDQAMSAVANALACPHDGWMPDTTLKNLRLIREAREQRDAVADWMLEVEAALEEAAKG